MYLFVYEINESSRPLRLQVCRVYDFGHPVLIFKVKESCPSRAVPYVFPDRRKATCSFLKSEGIVLPTASCAVLGHCQGFDVAV